MRFLHTADWQIGRQYGRLPPDRAVLLAEARFSAVERLARLATEHRVEAVLVAGDVFDAQTVSDRTIRRLFNALAGFAGPWILIPGNHDAALPESVWTRAQRLQAVPPNAHLALTPDILGAPEWGFAILPAPLTQRQSHSDLTAWFDGAETTAGQVRIGLAHGSVQGLLADSIDSPNPIAPDRASRARLDYLALGDWHGCRQIDPRTWYSGTPEPDRFKANGAGQALLVEVAAPGATPQVTALPTGHYRWQTLRAALHVETDLDGLLDTLGALDGRDVVELQVEGSLDLAGHDRLHAALGEAEAVVGHLEADLSRVCLQPTEADIARLDAQGYLGEVIAELKQEAQAPGEAGLLAQDALVLLTTALQQQRAPQ